MSSFESLRDRINYTFHKGFDLNYTTDAAIRVRVDGDAWQTIPVGSGTFALFSRSRYKTHQHNIDDSGLEESIVPELLYLVEFDTNGDDIPDETRELAFPECRLTWTYAGGFQSSKSYTLPRTAADVTFQLGDLDLSGFESDPEPSPLADWEGRLLELPYLVPDGAESVEVQIGDQTITFPVTADDIDGGDLVNLQVTVPPNWDGMITIDGETIPIAPRVQYTGDPTMEYMANLYDASLPPGVTPIFQGQLDLPPGVSQDATLGLPEGVTGVTIGQPTGGNLPIGVTRIDGSSKWTYQDLAEFNAPTPTSGTTGTSVESSSQPSAEGEESLTDAGSIDGFNSGGDPTLPPESLESVGDQWETIKAQIVGKFGSFAPLASQSIPTINTLTVPLAFGPLGNRTLNLDFTGEPFPAVRTLILVIVIFHAGVSFIRFLRV